MAFADTVAVSGCHGAREEVSLGQVAWEEVERLLLRLDQDDIHSVVITNENDDVRLSILLGTNGLCSVNWFDDSGRNSGAPCWVLDEGAVDGPEVATVAKWDQGARYPSSQFVSLGSVQRAAAEFYTSGKRAESLAWSQDP